MRDLADHVHKIRIEQCRDVEFASVKTVQYVFSDALCICIAQAFDLGHVNMPDQMIGELTFQLVTALFTNGKDFHLFTGGK